MRREILGVFVDAHTLSSATASAMALLRQPGCHTVVTPNAEMLLLARRSPDVKKVLNRAALSVADGIGVVRAAAILGQPLPARVPGIELAEALLPRLAEDGRRLFLFGGKPGVAERAADAIQRKYPELTICGTCHGYYPASEPVIARIRAAQADVVFVCLGAPKQEFWMYTHGEDTGARLLLGLGGTIDGMAGNVRRAPHWMRRWGLEWFYRLLTDPRRIGRMARLPLVLLYAARERRKKA